MKGNTGYTSGHMCGSGHVFVFAGSPEVGKIPDGYPCSCGQYKAKWTTCPFCGQDKLEQEEGMKLNFKRHR